MFGQREGESCEKSGGQDDMLPTGILSLRPHVSSWAKRHARTFRKNWKSHLAKNYQMRKRCHRFLSLQTDLKRGTLAFREATNSGMGWVEERPQG